MVTYNILDIERVSIQVVQERVNQREEKIKVNCSLKRDFEKPDSLIISLSSPYAGIGYSDKQLSLSLSDLTFVHLAVCVSITKKLLHSLGDSLKSLENGRTTRNFQECR